MGGFAEQAAGHHQALLALREELRRLGEALAPADEVFASTAAGLDVAREAAEVLSWRPTTGNESPAAAERLLKAATSLGALQPQWEQLGAALAAVAGGGPGAGGGIGGADKLAGVPEPRPKPKRAKARPRMPLDVSAFTRARWEAERLKCISLMSCGTEDGEAAEPGAGGSGIKVYMQDMPKPFQPEKPCTQVKGRHIMVNSAEKARKIYVELSVSGTVDRTGYVRGANLARFSSLAMERSDCPTAKKGGDLGWISKGKVDAKLEEVALAAPRGTCSPPFKVGNSFHLFLCEERKG